MKKLLTFITLLAVTTPALADEQFSLGTGFDYSSGKYGNATSTDILYIPVIGKFELDKLTFKLTVPYISISGPGGIVRSVGRMRRVTTTTATTSSNSGLGDIIASAGYNFYDEQALVLDLVGNLKFGTADANKGLGTGQNDYSVQVDGYYDLGKNTLFATAGYKSYGAPSGLTLNNTPYGSLGVSQKLSNKTSAGAMLDMALSPSTNSADQLEAIIFVSQKVSPSLKMQANLLKGLSNGSPDYGGGFMVTGMF
jgi:hypothetical protein